MLVLVSLDNDNVLVYDYDPMDPMKANNAAYDGFEKDVDVDLDMD